MECLFVLMFVLIFDTGILFARNRESKDWNNGISPYTNKPWVSFDMDSQGGRGYRDENGNTIWISYNVDKKL